MAKFKEYVDALAGLVGREAINTEESATVRFAVDDVIPKAVVFPSDPEQVARVVGFAYQNDLAVVPMGGGSKMGAGNPPSRLDLVVSLSRLNRILDMDVANLTLTVQAGARFRDVQGSLASQDNRCYLPHEDLERVRNEAVCSIREHKGCFVPLDPPCCDQATMGGILASDSTGPRRLLYGRPRDLVLGVRFVTPGGEIVGAGGKTVKNVSGYDISKLMIGSAGTLGILCEMTLRLLPLPEKMETLLLSFGSFGDASSFVERVFETPLLPAAVEILKGVTSDGAGGGGSAGYAVAVALEGVHEAVERMNRELMDMGLSLGAYGDCRFREAGHRDFWRKISNLLPTISSLSPGLVALKLSYPMSAWKELFEYTGELLDGHGVAHTMQTHAGNGVSLVNLLLRKDTTELQDKAVQAVHDLLARCRSLDGTLTVQRAPADLKPRLPVWGEPGEDLQVMKSIKSRLDPSGIMSPGRFLGGI